MQGRSAWIAGGWLVVLASAAHAGDELDVLVLDDGGSNTADLATALGDAGHTVTVSTDEGVVEYDFDGSVGSASLSDFDAVIWLDGDAAFTVDMATAGQVALDGYVSRGGGLVMLGAPQAAVEDGLNARAAGLMLLEGEDISAKTLTFTVDDASHRSCEDYTTGDSFFLTVAALSATGHIGDDAPLSVSIDGSSAPALSVGDLDRGRVAQFAWFGDDPGSASYDLDYTNADVELLVLGALQYVALRAPDVDAGSYTVAAEGSVDLSATATDHDGGDVTCVWDPEGDGFDGDTGLDATFEATGYDGPDSEEVLIRCTDDEGEETTATAVVTIENVDPTIEKVAASGVLEEGAPTSFAVEASDVEDDPLTRTWDFGDGDTDSGASPVHAYADDGTYTVVVTVEDDDGGVAEESIEVAIANVAPTIAASRSPTGIVSEGDELSFTSEVTDVEADTYSYAWDFGDGTSSTDAAPTHTYTQDGSYSFSVTVTDDDGDSGSTTGSVTVSNAAPTVEVSGDEVGEQGEQLQWTCAAEDPGDDTLSYSWDFGDGATGTGSATYHAFDAVGTATVTCTVDDGTDSTSASLDVAIANAAPEIDTLAIGGGEEGASLTFYVSASDPGGDKTTVSWDFGDGSTGFGSTVTHTYTDDGDYLVTVTVSDGTDETSASDTAAVTNVAPTLSGTPDAVAYPGITWTFTPSVSDPGTGDTVGFGLTADVEAELGDAGSVSWTPSTDTEGTFGFVLTATDDDGGYDTLSWTVTVGGTDSDGDGMTDDWEGFWGLDPEDASDAEDDPDGDGKSNLDEFLTGSDPTSYGGPDAPTVVSPIDGVEVADQTPPMTVTNATDGDGDALSYYFEVYADEALSTLVSSSSGVSEDTSGTTTWTPGSALEENTDFWWVAAADDGWIRGDSSDVGSFFVNATNEAPEVPELVTPWDGASVDLAEPVLTLAEPVDPDRDAVTLSVTVYDDGYQVVGELSGASATDGELSVEAPGVDEAGSWCFYAWATDEHGLEGDSSAVSCFTAVEDNQPPAAPIFVTPTDGEALDDFALEVLLADGDDPEGATVKHTIELDLSPEFDSEALQTVTLLADGSGSTSWALEDELPAESTIYLRAWADDGLDVSELVSIVVTTSSGHEAPGQPRPASPSHGELVTSTAVVLEALAATDPDGDVLSYRFEVLRTDTDELAAESELVLADAAGLVAWTTPELAPGSYGWRLVAEDDYDVGPWSDWAYFYLDGAEEEEEGALVGCACDSGASAVGAWWLLALAPWLRRRRVS